ncbi:MAG TPA: glutathione peroxidase [Bacteroidia bacterium]|nr:glutathione peroxidase [Bacteroidia bacterium]
MKKVIIPSLLFLGIISFSMKNDATHKTLYDFHATTIDGKDFDFSSLKGKKVMIVNTASECGFTPQYQGLEELYKKYQPTGKFEIIGFPCNQFGGQEPGTNDTIKSFCSRNYGVTFQMMSKIDVKGDSIHPIYKWLCNKDQNGVESSDVKWNFQKYLIDENGHLVKHCLSPVKPMDPEITNWIEGK